MSISRRKPEVDFRSPFLRLSDRGRFDVASLYGDVLIAFSMEEPRFTAQNLMIKSNMRNALRTLCTTMAIKHGVERHVVVIYREAPHVLLPLNAPLTQYRSSWYGRPFYASLRSMTLTLMVTTEYGYTTRFLLVSGHRLRMDRGVYFSLRTADSKGSAEILGGLGATVETGRDDYFTKKQVTTTMRIAVKRESRRIKRHLRVTNPFSTNPEGALSSSSPKYSRIRTDTITVWFAFSMSDRSLWRIALCGVFLD